MNGSKKVIISVSVILIILISSLLIRSRYENYLLQKHIDNTYLNSLSKVLEGLSKDYTEMDRDQKIMYYYQTVNNLENVLNIVEHTSLKEKVKIHDIVNRLHLYLANNAEINYIIRNGGDFYRYLIGIRINPNDTILIQAFNDYLDSLGAN